MKGLFTLLACTLLFLIPLTAETPKSPLLTDPDLKQFADAVLQTNLRDLFTGTGPFTVFVPNNAAIDKFGTMRLQQLINSKNQDALVDLLISHVITGKYMANMLKTMDVTSVGGKPLHIKVNNGKITVNNAKVIRTDLVGPNGVIHVIDTVLEP